MEVIDFPTVTESRATPSPSSQNPPRLLPRSTLNQFQQTVSMAGKTSHPIHIHPVRPLYRFTATALGASMWFFLMYRAKKDGAVLLGWKHPWDH
ncbi:unnamed protein product [Penicillium salamii]|uniref:NADH dehydrogenase [ubiquinone] 1 beta subcomplex subunit 2 n=3 Tax=Penicillium TaxID=5073 RepID=A0A9W4ISA5_9EURO|nr:unnamed protein product [Penicillium salamii]CAG8144835.1 unnamed protein product [Penicillium salamii]CAG8303782.1 unnamed protein product [Penicillium salamii]CAG8333184.1 unnamed protein product [Penicillium salamii]CAG8356057.1 unnamed protein product [Penicillium salamii]